MNRKITTAFIFLVIMSLFAASICEAKDKVRWEKSNTGVGSLMDLSKDRGNMVKEYDKETDRYEKVKAAIEGNELEKGETSSNVARVYGEPVIVLKDPSGEFQQWVYKPGDKTFLDGEKLYLVFDSEEKLESWEVVQPEAGPAD